MKITKKLIRIFIFSFIILSVCTSINVCFADYVPIAKSVREVVEGRTTRCAVTIDDELYCWGTNNFGQVGNASTEDQLTPVKVMENVSSVSIDSDINSASNGTVCSIKTNGDLYCWGYNYEGQVGIGNRENQVNPVKILGNVISVFQNHSVTCALKTDKTFYCWGDNTVIQNVNNNGRFQLTPVQVLDDVDFVSLSSSTIFAIKSNGALYCSNDWNNLILDDVKSVSPSDGTICALKTNNDLYCWGNNSRGQVGNGSKENQLTPVKVLDNVNTISINNATTCAIRINGDLYCWGEGSFGRLGNGGAYDQLTPALILQDITFVSIGIFHTCAIKTNGDLYCWGNNDNGQVGNGNLSLDIQYEDGVRQTLDDQLIPVKILEGVSFVSLVFHTTCAIKVNGDLYCWGNNDNGQVGNGSSGINEVPVKILEDVAFLSLEIYRGTTACAIKKDGALYCWGGGYSIIGCGDIPSQTTPPQEPIISNIESASINVSRSTVDVSSCVIKSNGDLYCWGRNNYGQVGNGSREVQLTPVKVLDDVISVNINNNTTCAIKTNRDLYCWGGNYYGQIGNGKTQAQLTPIKILENVASVTQFNFTTCAIKTNGELYCWGRNLDGQVGNDSQENQLLPVFVLDNVSAVSASYETICAIKINGDLYCWGDNDSGQVGSGDYKQAQLTPVKILDNIVSVNFGGFMVCAVKTNGDLYCWGDNYWGTIGNGSKEDQLTPLKVLEDVSLIGLYGDSRMCAIKVNGDLYCWGSNINGEVGNGNMEDQLNPVKVLENVVSVTFEQSFSCATTTDGDLYFWGRNWYNQVENIDNQFQLTPLKILEDISFVSTSTINASDTVCVIKTNKDLYCWGNNFNGQVGNGNTSGQSAPVKVFDDVKSVMTLERITCAIKTNGGLYCWGDNRSGFINGISQYLPNQIFDGTGNDPMFMIDCSDHWNYASLNGNCSNGVGACLKNGTYGCYGIINKPSIVCNAIAGEPQREVCNNIDDNCNGHIDEGFNIGEVCQNEIGTGELICKDDDNVECNIITTFTPTFTNTYTSSYTYTNTYTYSPIATEMFTSTPTLTMTNTPTFISSYTNVYTNTYTSTVTNVFTLTLTPTRTNVFPSNTFTYTPTVTLTPTNILSVIDIITPQTKLPLPAAVSSKKQVKIQLPKIEKASLGGNSKKKVNIKYLVSIKKVKRVGKKDSFYKLGVSYEKLTSKNNIKLSKLDKGTYKVKYRVLITQGRKNKMTKWSKAITIKIN